MCQNYLEMSRFGVEVIVGMRTEAKPFSLGRSGSAHSNERPCDCRSRDPWPHVLVSLTPRVIYLGFANHDRTLC